MMSREENLKQAINAISDIFDKEKKESYEDLKLARLNDLPSINDFDLLLYNLEDKVIRLIESGKEGYELSHDAKFLYMKIKFVKHQFRSVIEKTEGSCCSADKVRSILSVIKADVVDGKVKEFDYDGEYTFHLPDKVFKTHDDIMRFFRAIKRLYYGNPVDYMMELQRL